MHAAVTLAIAVPALAAGAPDDRYDALIRDAITEAGGRHPPPLALVKAVIRQESAFRPKAVSRAGARGLMQVMPGTAKRVGIRPEDLFDPTQNIRAGVRLLAVLLDHYRGDVISALVAYNARPRSLFAPIPRNGETPGYVWAVLAYYEWYSRREQRLGGDCGSAPVHKLAEVAGVPRERAEQVREGGRGMSSAKPRRRRGDGRVAFLALAVLERRPECMASTAAEKLAVVLHEQPEDLYASAATATRGHP